LFFLLSPREKQKGPEEQPDLIEQRQFSNAFFAFTSEMHYYIIRVKRLIEDILFGEEKNHDAEKRNSQGC
jgi:hypothetical protein